MEDQTSIYTELKKLIIIDMDLPDDIREEYLECLDNLAGAKRIDADMMEEIADYLDNKITAAEKKAVEENDLEMIEIITKVYEERNKLDEVILMLYDSKDPAYKESPEVKDRQIKNLLNRISTAASK